MRTDIGPEGIPVDPAVEPVIHTVDQYEAATRRVQQLTFCRNESREGLERDALLKAIMAWDRRHDDATGWE